MAKIEWQKHIIEHGVDDLYVSGYVEEENGIHKFTHSYYDLYLESKDKLIKFSTEYACRIDVSFVDKVKPVEWMDEDDFFSFSSIYKLIFIDEFPSKVLDVHIKNKKNSDELFLTYKSGDLQKRLIRFDPLTIYGFAIYNERLELVSCN